MGGAARPLHDTGNDRSVERRSNRQVAGRGRLTVPANPAGERETVAALTPRPGTRSFRLGGGSRQTRMFDALASPFNAKRARTPWPFKCAGDTGSATLVRGRAKFRVQSAHVRRPKSDASAS